MCTEHQADTGARDRRYKEKRRKSENLENFIKTIFSSVKKHLFRNIMGKNSTTINEILTYTIATDLFEAKAFEALNNELKKIHKSKQYGRLHLRLNEYFGEQLCDESFLRWFANKLGIGHSERLKK